MFDRAERARKAQALADRIAGLRCGACGGPCPSPAPSTFVVEEITDAAEYSRRRELGVPTTNVTRSTTWPQCQPCADGPSSSPAEAIAKHLGVPVDSAVLELAYGYPGDSYRGDPKRGPAWSGGLCWYSQPGASPTAQCPAGARRYSFLDGLPAAYRRVQTYLSATTVGHAAGCACCRVNVSSRFFDHPQGMLCSICSKVAQEVDLVGAEVYGGLVDCALADAAGVMAYRGLAAAFGITAQVIAQAKPSPERFDFLDVHRITAWHQARAAKAAREHVLPSAVRS